MALALHRAGIRRIEGAILVAVAMRENRLRRGKHFGLRERAVLVRIGPVEHLSGTRQHEGTCSLERLAGLILVCIRSIANGLAGLLEGRMACLDFVLRYLAIAIGIEGLEGGGSIGLELVERDLAVLVGIEAFDHRGMALMMFAFALGGESGCRGTGEKKAGGDGAEKKFLFSHGRSFHPSCPLRDRIEGTLAGASYKLVIQPFGRKGFFPCPECVGLS